MEQKKSSSTGPRFVCVVEVERRVSFSSSNKSAYMTERLYTLPRFVRTMQKKQEERQGDLCRVK